MDSPLPPSPPLTPRQREILDVALGVLDERGLDGLTMRVLSDALGVKAPAVYWHFANKELLVDHLAEVILGREMGELTERAPEEPWQDWLGDLMRALRRAMLAHRDGARVIAGAHLDPAVTLANLTEVGLRSLLSAGLSARQAHTLVTTLTHFTFGRVIEEQSSPAPEVLDRLGDDEVGTVYPAIAQVWRCLDERSPDADFEASLDLIIRGREHLEGARPV